MVKDRMKQEACDEFEEKLFDVFNKVLWVVNDKFQEFQDIMIHDSANFEIELNCFWHETSDKNCKFQLR